MYTKVLIAFFLVAVVFAGSSVQAKKVGGLSEEMPANENILKIASEVREAAQAKLADETFNTYIPVSYATQVVAGVNYFIKVDIGANYYVVLRVYSAPDGSLSLHSAKSHVGKDEPISYF